MNKELLADQSVNIEIKRDIIDTLGSELFSKKVNIEKPLIFRKGFDFERYILEEKYTAFRCENKDFHIYVIYKPVIVDSDYHNVIEVVVKITKFNQEKGVYELAQESSKLYHASALEII